MALLSLEALGGRRMNVELAGEGTPILAIHGFTGSASSWDAFQEAARADHTVIRVELLGHGASDCPDSPEPYGMTPTVRALEGILDYLKLDRAHWLGYSLGGRIALCAAVLLPRRTRSLIAESASPGLFSEEERVSRVRSDEALADWMEKVGIEAFVDRWESLPIWATQSRLSVAQRRQLRRQRLSGNPRGLANSLRGIGAGAQPPLHHRLHELRAPALFVAGEEDGKFAAIAEQMNKSVPNGHLRIVKQAGHAVHLEQQGLFNRAVLDFVKAVDASPEFSRVQTGSQQSL
ncbi:MAG: 2-succinyl-6-hydroxy-2,4-cyclohexadiene-1-carboxylate synthase [Dehalococcoidia bacterium]|nr:2-succinyl-6-hydroxy-2,4-cyclohexadiene-1-carboxylate synthase [Dehalococcoidia bacterium]